MDLLAGLAEEGVTAGGWRIVRVWSPAIGWADGRLGGILEENGEYGILAELKQGRDGVAPPAVASGLPRALYG